MPRAGRRVIEPSLRPVAGLDEETFLRLTAGFSSGAPTLDRWLHTRAWTNSRKGYTATVLAVHGDAAVGYFGLSAATVLRASLPGKHRRNAPEAIPVVLLGQLAVRQAFHGQGLGEFLLMAALDRALQGSGRIGAAHVLTDPLDEATARFYAKYGFQPCPGVEGKLPPMFLPMATVDEVLGAGR